MSGTLGGGGREWDVLVQLGEPVGRRVERGGGCHRHIFFRRRYLT